MTPEITFNDIDQLDIFEVLAIHALRVYNYQFMAGEDKPVEAAEMYLYDECLEMGLAPEKANELVAMLMDRIPELLPEVG